MAEYRITFAATAANIQQIQKKVKDVFGVDITPQIVKVNHPNNRFERLAEAESLVEEAKEQVSSLKSDLEEQRDNLPENLSNSERASELDNNISELEQLESSLEDVTFPELQ